MDNRFKVCKKCLKKLPIDMFYIKKQNKDGRDSYCRDCQRAYANNYRRCFPEKVKESRDRTRAVHAERIRAQQREWYHKNKDTEKYVFNRKVSIEKNKRKWQETERAKRTAFNEKYKTVCKKCGEDRLYLIQFHHIDPNTKSFCIGAKAVEKSEEELLVETKKCICLCANCHIEFHHLYGSRPENPEKSLADYLGEPYGI